MPGSTTRSGADLVAICTATVPPLAPHDDVDFLHRLRRHRVAALAHVVFARAGSTRWTALRDDYIAAVGQHTRNLAALRDLSNVLAELPWVVLKGPVLSALAHPVPGLRQYSDLDVLVSPTSFPAAVARLSERGWRLLDGDHRLVLERLPGELHFAGPFGAQLDLHWSLVNGHAARSAYALPARTLLARRVLRDVERFQVPSLDDVDFLIHICLHAALSGADRMIWLLDVDQWVRGRDIDWDLLAARCAAAGASAAVALVLGRAARTLATPVPAQALHTRGVGAWVALDAVLAAVQPVPGLTRQRSPARLLARSSRSGSWDSATTLLRRASAARASGSAPESAWKDRPDEASWRAFLDWVAEQE